MKILLLSFALLISNVSQAQTDLTFNYDDAGNQILRELCLFGCYPTSKKIPKEIESITNEDLQKFSSNDDISYYPNPVKEELYLKWDLKEENHVTSISVYGINGQILNNYYKTENSDTQNISFYKYPSGIYLITLNYKTGEPKTIKIIKK